MAPEAPTLTADFPTAAFATAQAVAGTIRDDGATMAAKLLLDVAGS
ncbi:hypothetical protein ACIOD2_23560 [Amycolatopsis sp. NPDC088138]